MANRIEDFSDDFDTVPRDEWVNFTVPAEDLMGNSLDTPKINSHEFPPGEHQMPPKYAEHLKILLDGAQKEAVRRLQPKKDIRALLQQSGGTGIKGSSKIQLEK